jgi:flagellar M-ring protein FliF
VGADAGSRDEQAKNEEIINYEISSTTRIETMEGGRLSRLSVAVLVDGRYAPGANGEMVYQPRPQEELEQIATLVRTAIGFDRNRGDQVEVINLPFAEAPALPPLVEATLLDQIVNPSMEDILRFLELAVIGILTLIVLFTVVRPLVKQILAAEEEKRKAPQRSQQPQYDELEPRPESQASKMIEMAKVNGQVQQQSLDRVGEMVKNQPSETVSVMRQWIHERG